MVKRSEQIAKKYLDTGIFNPEHLQCGSQMSYEIEQDLQAMKWAIAYLQSYIEYRKTIRLYHTFGDQHCNQAFEILVNRVAEYNCPSNRKPEFKNIENCPMGEKCKCENNGW